MLIINKIRKINKIKMKTKININILKYNFKKDKILNKKETFLKRNLNKFEN